MNHVWNISSKSLIHRKSVQENKNILHRSKAHGLSKMHIWNNWELHRRNSFTKRFELQKIRYHNKTIFLMTLRQRYGKWRYEKSITRWTEGECSWMKCDVTERECAVCEQRRGGATARDHLFPLLTAKRSCEPLLAWSRRRSDFRAYSMSKNWARSSQNLI